MESKSKTHDRSKKSQTLLMRSIQGVRGGRGLCKERSSELKKVLILVGQLR
jgi:hypothetical protein